ncbi:MAG: hypothetical protein KKC75_05415 [Nanoarchaeota archaeon]|nr:hypothetical protein [Nanoarchaeota archaeon]MBU1005015.1 hypothetical protein [Nanoarchaeota archaeon]MBU1945907.1 hypothetical protein [Nanoarchaeota archaeon]
MSQEYDMDEEEPETMKVAKHKMYCSYCNEEMQNKGKVFECPICESTYKEN